MLDFQEAYYTTMKNIGGNISSNSGWNYIESVQNEIDKLSSDINSFKGHKTDISKLKGDVFEFWHSGTHNVEAATKGVKSRTFVDRSTGLGSPDISSNYGEDYGLKNYSNASKSVYQQSKTFYQRYKEYTAQSRHNISYEDWLKKNNISDIDPNESLYLNQTKIIPKDQLFDAIRHLEQKIVKEELTRPDQVKRYKDTLAKLTDKIKSPDGSESIPLTKEESEIIAQLAKDGEFNPVDFGLTTEEIIKYKYVISQAMKAGLSSAIITIILKITPEIYKSIEQLIAYGEIDREQLNKIGFAAISGGAEGFIRGSVAAGITVACKSGALGKALKTIDPSMIGAATVIVMNAIQNSFKVSTGKMSKSEFVNACLRDTFITACSMTLGGITQGLIEIPILGFMLGSFVGSYIGGVAFTATQNIVMSFCVESGFTFFGMVDQNYELPKEMLEEIGFKVLDYEKVMYKAIQHKAIQHKTVKHKIISHNTLNIHILRRGVIGVNKIGYIVS